MVTNNAISQKIDCDEQFYFQYKTSQTITTQPNLKKNSQTKPNKSNLANDLKKQKNRTTWKHLKTPLYPSCQFYQNIPTKKYKKKLLKQTLLNLPNQTFQTNIHVLPTNSELTNLV